MYYNVDILIEEEVMKNQAGDDVVEKPAKDIGESETKSLLAKIFGIFSLSKLKAFLASIGEKIKRGASKLEKVLGIRKIRIKFIRFLFSAAFSRYVKNTKKYLKSAKLEGNTRVTIVYNVKEDVINIQPKGVKIDETKLKKSLKEDLKGIQKYIGKTPKKFVVKYSAKYGILDVQVDEKTIQTFIDKLGAKIKKVKEFVSKHKLDLVSAGALSLAVIVFSVIVNKTGIPFDPTKMEFWKAIYEAIKEMPTVYKVGIGLILLFALAALMRIGYTTVKKVYEVIKNIVKKGKKEAEKAAEAVDKAETENV